MRTTSSSTSVNDILKAFDALDPEADVRERVTLCQQWGSMLRAGWTSEEVAALAGAYTAIGGSDPGSFARWAEQRRRRIRAYWQTD